MIEPDPTMPEGNCAAENKPNTAAGYFDGIVHISIGILIGVVCLFGSGVLGRVLFEVARLGWRVWDALKFI